MKRLHNLQILSISKNRSFIELFPGYLIKSFAGTSNITYLDACGHV